MRSLSKNNVKNFDATVALFNKRDRNAFGDIYDMVYNELFLFTNSLYSATTIDPKDIIQDAFVKLWDRDGLVFKSVSEIKSYLYVSIKNSYKVHYNHQKVTDKAHHEISKDEDYYIVQAAKAEVYSFIGKALNMLPAECAKIFKLFLDGYSVKEIADITGKRESTVYNQKNEAISILRKKLSKDKLMLIMIILGN